MDLYKLYTGELMGFTPEENRECLLKDINYNLYENKQDNNMKIINRELEKYGGYNIDFINGPKNVFLICAVSSQDDYYYIYYDDVLHKIKGNTGCDGILNYNNSIKELSHSYESIDKLIDDYIDKYKYTEVPFTTIYKTNNWKFNFNK